MNFTNNQMKRLIAISNQVEIINTLHKLYISYEDKEINRENIKERNVIYKLYCCSLFNAMDALKKANKMFTDFESEYELELNLFYQIIDKKYITSNHFYYKKIGHEATLYKILSKFRDQNSHYEIDENDEISLFEIEVDFVKLEELRKVINDLFNKIYNLADKDKLKQIILSKSKIKYNIDKMNESVETFNLKIFDETLLTDDATKKDYEKILALFSKIYNQDFLYAISNGDESAFDELSEIDKENNNLFLKYYNKMLEEGDDKDKKALEIVKRFLEKNEKSTFKESKDNLKKFIHDLKNVN